MTQIKFAANLLGSARNFRFQSMRLYAFEIFSSGFPNVPFLKAAIDRERFYRKTPGNRTG